MSNKLRIVFMGTPEFAVASLNALINSSHEVVSVVTAPDRPANRGLKLQQSAVKEYAINARTQNFVSLQILQPEKMKDESFITKLKELNPDLIVVVAFRMLPEVVWSIPKYGTINLHASLLPQYRGAAPINWAIINGEKVTGVTTFFINERIDTGDVLQVEKVSISDEDTAGTLHDKLMETGAKLLVKTVDTISDGNKQVVKQDDIPADKLKPAPKIFRDNCRINFNMDCIEVYNFIRGLSPYPGAWTEMENMEAGKKFSVKIFHSAKHPEMSLPCGTISIMDKLHIYIGCNSGSIEILEIQSEGKKIMPVADFLRGNQLDSQKWKVIF